MTIPIWMSGPHQWQINMMEGVECTPQKGVTFDTSGSHIKVKLDGAWWGTLDLVTDPDTVTVTGLTDPGSQPPSQPFHIDYDCNGDTLCCYVEENYPQFLVKLGCGMLAGAAFGLLIGFAGGSPRLGALAGLAGAMASSAVTQGRKLIPQHIWIFLTNGGGSSPTWVANDSGSGSNLGTQPEPARLRATA